LLGSAVTNPRKTLAVIQLSGQEKNADATEWFIHNYLPKATFSYQRIAAYGVGTRALADIAQGKADLFFAIRSGGGYDNAAAKTILEAAGCVVTDFDGSKWSVETSKGVLAAGNQTLFDIAHEKIAELQREGKKLPE